MIIPQSLPLLNLLENQNYILTYFIRGQIPEPKEDQYVVTPVHPGVQTKWVQSKLSLWKKLLIFFCKLSFFIL